MVVNPLWIGGSIGVVLSGAFVYWEVGRYAAPQVPASLFDERKEVIAYTVGLFLGVVLSIPFGLFLTSLADGPLVWAIVGLAILLAGFELAQRLLLRTQYFGSGQSGPFYAIGFRTGAAAILVLTLTSLYLGTSSVDATGVVALLLESGAIVGLSAAGALMSVAPTTSATGTRGGPLSSLLLTGVGFFLLGLGQLFGPFLGGLAAALILIMSLRIYQRLRESVLGSIRPPGVAPKPEPGTPSPFGRTDR
ncbi:MAG TPA: hypothetical protein VEY07_03420 [Thermoplasmata archaeon]|nr:hypothetical protein [Thermoplasmata archaeon]